MAHRALEQRVHNAACQMHTRFESLGAYLPKTVVSTRELLADMQFVPQFDLQHITGIANRRVHDRSNEHFEDSFALAMAAAKDCLSRSRYRAEEIDAVISVSITRYVGGYRMFFEPSMALMLKRAFGASRAIHFDVSNACAGMMTGVMVLDRMIKAGVVKNGIVVSGECITPIAQTAVKEAREPLDPQFGSLTVGDAGAAVILDPSEDERDRLHYCELMTCAEYAKLCIGMPSEERCSPALYTNNAEMHKEERVQLWPRFQAEFLAKRGSSFADEKYDYVVHHQVGTRAINNFNRYGSAIFKAEMPESLACVAELGNTASTSHFVVLYEHLREKRVKKGAKFLFVPAASGVITGCVSATISSLEV
jgi:3-oxoacyl-[acyl-carrier-protein] synthase-3